MSSQTSTMPINLQDFRESYASFTNGRIAKLHLAVLDVFDDLFASSADITKACEEAANRIYRLITTAGKLYDNNSDHSDNENGDKADESKEPIKNVKYL